METLGPTHLLDALLDSWDRSNRILVNLLRALPPGALHVRAIPSSPTIGEQFTHLNYVRLVFLSEDAPEFALSLPAGEWLKEENLESIAQSLESSAAAVRAAVEAHILSGHAMKTNYDHPVLFMQHMIFHDSYHHGQIKLALKLSGLELDDSIVGPLTWGLLIDKTGKTKDK